MHADISAAVLVGGHGRRLGYRDKARLPSVQPGRNLLERLSELLRSQVHEVLLVGRPEQSYPEVDCRLVVDQRVNVGPLAAVEAALLATRTRWSFVVAVDLPTVDAAVLARLSAARRPDDEAVVFRGPRGYEPLCALYHTRLAGEVSAALDRGVLSLQRWLPTRRCSLVELSAAEQEAWLNLNDPEMLLRYLSETAAPLTGKRGI